jgi:hypothetical protein|tara:strand:- start:235 stop:366 length:132 start_codon:yes stop_codon:yes gene_type:complete
MEEIKTRIWERYMTVKGGDFPQWYEGLSPIEKIVLGNLLREND